jgi:hypothetical protein
MLQLPRGGRDDLKGTPAPPTRRGWELTCSLQVGFKIFLNITPTITNWSSDNKQFSLIFEENPLADFVELPDDGRAQDELWFSNILVGVLRGALEMACCPSLWATWTNVYAGTHAGRGTFHQRRAPGQRHDGDEDISDPLH